MGTFGDSLKQDSPQGTGPGDNNASSILIVKLTLRGQAREKQVSKTSWFK